MKLFQKIKKLISNPHIYTALIAAAIILGASWFYKTTENKGYFILLFTTVAISQMYIARVLTKKRNKTCKIKS
jgi:uncharacterized membrane protein